MTQKSDCPTTSAPFLAVAKRRPTVLTLVEPTMRGSITEATKAYCTIVHATSMTEAVQGARDSQVQALIVSPGVVAQERMPDIATLVAKCSGTMTVAVIAEHKAVVEQGLLDLGSCGVRRAINLADRNGWRNLQEFVSRAAESITAQILERIMPALQDISEDMRRFVETTIRSAPVVTTVRTLAYVLRVHPSSLMSRFFRVKLPAPKGYLSAARLMYAAAYFDNSGLSVAKVADRLEYSSPQSFGRNIRTTMGMTAVNFRYRYSLQGMTDYFVRTLITPHRETLRTFDPFGARPELRRWHRPDA
jgi:methylphosphotriester-DNA--protein-cysteine methyltransferase